MPTERTDRVSTPDGDFDLHVWLPDHGRPAPGLLVVQEIFGVSEYIRAVAAELAERGYVAAAPDLFWRLRPNWEAKHDQEGVEQSLALSQRFDAALGVLDSLAALEHVRGLAEVSEQTGAVGFCLGGTIVYLLAATAELDVAVSYYGSGVPDTLDRLAEIRRPLQMQFAGSDQFIPREAVARVEAAVEGASNVELHVHEHAGHAFHNRFAAQFHDEAAAAEAWERTLRFLDEHCPAPAAVAS